MNIGDIVIFTDAVGKDHNALVTSVFDNGDPEKYPTPSLNVVYVTEDESKHDMYGRQIERNTSVVHESNQAAHGMKWRPVNSELFAG